MPTSDKADKELQDKPLARIDFARRLRELRVMNGYRTARSLARAVGIDENRYTRYERAEVEPDLSLIRMLASVLRTTPNDLLGLGTPVPGFNDNAATQPPIDGAAGIANHRAVSPVRGERVAAITWAIANIIAEVRHTATEPKGNGAADADGTSRSSGPMLPHISAIYQQLTVDPFGVVAAERSLAHAPAEVQHRVRGLLDDLARTLGE